MAVVYAAIGRYVEILVIAYIRWMNNRLAGDIVYVRDTDTDADVTMVYKFAAMWHGTVTTKIFNRWHQCDCLEILQLRYTHGRWRPFISIIDIKNGTEQYTGMRIIFKNISASVLPGRYLQ